MLAQVLLLLAILGILLYVARRQHGVRIQAGKRIAFFAFIALNAYAVLRPADLTWMANRLGIGRGADLLLYVLVVAFVFFALNTYLRFQEHKHQLTELTRTLAIREAELVNRERGVIPPGEVSETASPSQSAHQQTYPTPERAGERAEWPDGSG